MAPMKVARMASALPVCNSAGIIRPNSRALARPASNRPVMIRVMKPNGIEKIPGFYAFYGFIGCVVLVLLATAMRKVLMRDEDYYDDVE